MKNSKCVFEISVLIRMYFIIIFSKIINDEALKLRSDLFDDYNKLERLRFLHFNTKDPRKLSSIASGSIPTINQNDLDVFTKERFENIKRLNNYLERELPNARLFIDAHLRRKNE
jgi:hypothetical protein